jgi:hypothetical protein
VGRSYLVGFRVVNAMRARGRGARSTRPTTARWLPRPATAFLSPRQHPKAKWPECPAPPSAVDTKSVAVLREPRGATRTPRRRPPGLPDARPSWRRRRGDPVPLPAVARSAQDRVRLHGKVERPAARSGEWVVGRQWVAAAGRIAGVRLPPPAWAEVAVPLPPGGDGFGPAAPVAMGAVAAHRRCSSAHRMSHHAGRGHGRHGSPSAWPPQRGHSSRQQGQRCGSPSRAPQSRQGPGHAACLTCSVP